MGIKAIASFEWLCDRFAVFDDNLCVAKCSKLLHYKGFNMSQSATECLEMPKRLAVTVDDNQHKLLEEIAGKEKRSLSGQLAKIVSDWLEEYQRDRTNSKGAK